MDLLITRRVIRPTPVRKMTLCSRHRSSSPTPMPKMGKQHFSPSRQHPLRPQRRSSHSVLNFSWWLTSNCLHSPPRHFHPRQRPPHVWAAAVYLRRRQRMIPPPPATPRRGKKALLKMRRPRRPERVRSLDSASSLKKSSKKWKSSRRAIAKCANTSRPTPRRAGSTPEVVRSTNTRTGRTTSVMPLVVR